MNARILIVDDDPWILRMVTTVLEKRGHQVFTATDGQEAFARALEVRPDLIITDVMMPRMDGWSLIRSLRAHSDFAVVPVIFLTALGGDDDRIQGFRLGADDYLAKPFRFEELDLRVGNALRKRADAVRTRDEVRLVAPPPRPPSLPPPQARSGLQGALAQLGLPSLLTILEMEKKSGILVVSRPNATARLFLQQGQVVSARLDDKSPGAPERKGADVVYHLVSWSEGTFSFNAVDVEMEDEIGQTTTHLLMEGARRLDEGGCGDIDLGDDFL